MCIEHGGAPPIGYVIEKTDISAVASYIYENLYEQCPCTWATTVRLLARDRSNLGTRNINTGRFISSAGGLSVEHLLD